MQTFEKVLEIFRDYLDRDLEEEVLQCRRGYLRGTWDGDSLYVCGIDKAGNGETLSKADDIFSGAVHPVEEIQLTGGRRDPNRGDEAALEQLRQSYLAQYRKGEPK